MKIKFDMDPKEIIGIVEAVSGYGKKELKVRRDERRLEAKKLEQQKTQITELIEENKRLMKKVEFLEEQINLGKGFVK